MRKKLLKGLTVKIMHT